MGGFKYESEGYRVHRHGMDPTVQAKWTTSNLANDSIASIKNTTNNQNYRTDGTWGKFKRDKNAAHIPLNGSGY